jgi:hypothetical protein
MQTGSSGTFICWKSGQTTFFSLWDRMEGEWLWTQYRNECINVPISKLRIETKPKRFGVFQKFFFQKGNVSLYFKNFKTKPKRFAVFQNFLKERYYAFQELKNQTKTFWIVPTNFFGKTELFECCKKFKNKTNHLLMNKNILALKENVLV